MLDEVEYNLSQTRRDQVGGISEEDSAASVLANLWVEVLVRFVLRRLIV